MISKIKRLIAATSAALVLTLASGTMVMAQSSGSPGQGNKAVDIQNSTCQGSALDFEGKAGNERCKNETKNTGKQANRTIATVINLFSVVVGVVSVLMIIYGGFRYITSGGESNNITTAKNTILYAIIGLVIVALAQFIVKFVLGKATGTT